MSPSQTYKDNKCVDCGTEIQRQSQRCWSCNVKNNRTASQTWIIERIQAWNERFGDPPSALDWNRAPSIRNKYTAIRLRQDEASDEEWPAVNTVRNQFGSWNAGIQAAGFQPMRSGHKRQLM